MGEGREASVSAHLITAGGGVAPPFVWLSDAAAAAF